MTSSPQDIAALLGSRICHDLISPIGAISNGVELLQMSGDGTGPEIDLISESVSNANARIRFFRVAFGATSPGQMIGAKEVRAILSDYTQGARVQIDWNSDGDQPRAAVKLAFLLVQCLETALPRGGQITVAEQDGIWSVAGQSERMKIVAPLWHSLLDGTPSQDIRAAEVQFLLLPLLMFSEDRTLSLDIAETGITARF